MEILPMDILALDILPLAGLLSDMYLRLEMHLRLRLQRIGIGRTITVSQWDDQTRYSSGHKAFHSVPPILPAGA
jgi:hypothetical protein